MWLYDLGEAVWEDAQAVASAMARLGREGAVVALLSSPCLCAGGQADLDQEVDFAFCRESGIPVFRRKTAGGTVCLAQVQVGLQVVLPRGHPLLKPDGMGPLRVAVLPALETCRDLKLAAEYRAPNEIVVGGRRIASACLAQIDHQVVAAACLALQFDAEMFARVLNVQAGELRLRIAELARARRTSLLEELGSVPDERALEGQVCAHLQGIVGDLQPAQIDARLAAEMRHHGSELLASKRWDERAICSNCWKVDVGAGTELRACAYKAPGGFLHAVCEWHEHRIVQASLSGDFFCYPTGGLYRLEAALVGVDADQLPAKVADLYGELGLVTPGIQPEHWGRVLTPAPVS